MYEHFSVFVFILSLILRPLGKSGSGWIADDGMIGGMKKVGGNGRTPRKPTHTALVHHKSHMARAAVEPKGWR